MAARSLRGDDSRLRRTRGRTSPLEPDWLLQRHIVRDVKGALAEVRGRLLDVGCGGRPYQAFLSPGVQYVGIDAEATANAMPDVWASALLLPFDDGSFDAVLCTQVLEHLPDPAAAVREMARVLRAPGRLILTAPQTWCLHEAPRDFFRFTPFGLGELCRRAGLTPRTLHREGGFWAVTGISLIMYLGAAALRFGRIGRAESAPACAGHRPPVSWRRLLWPLRLPMALVNVVFALLDALPQSGEFAVNHLVVAEKDGTGTESRRA